MILRKYDRFIFIIIGLAATLRVWGVWHGYPFSYYPDEAHFVKRALSFGSGDLNPHWFHKPAFFMYLLFFEYGVYFLLGKLIGLWASVSDFAVSYVVNPGPFYIIGRMTTVLFSLGSIFIVYLIGENHLKKNAGLLAALFLTCTFGHVVASQDIKADTPAMFFGVLSLYFLLNYIDTNRSKDVLLSVLFCAVGTATKVYPIVLLVPICSVIIINDIRYNRINMQFFLRKTVSLIVVLILFWGVYFICSPYNFLDPLGREFTFEHFNKVIIKAQNLLSTEEIASSHDFISDKTGLLGGLVHYFKVLLSPEGMAWGIGLLGSLGLVYLFTTPTKKNLIFLMYPALFMLISIFQAPGYAEPRHQLPVYSCFALTGAVLVIKFINILSLHKKYLGLLICLTITLPLYNIIIRNVVVSRDDTRNIAKTWIEANILSNSKLLIDEEGPQLLLNRESINLMLQKAQKADPSGQFTAHYGQYLQYQLHAADNFISYEIFEIRRPWWRETSMGDGVHELTDDYDKDMGNPLKSVGVETYDYYLNKGYDYAIVNSYYYSTFFKDNKASQNFPDFTLFYKELFNRGKLIKEFSPIDKPKRPGPDVKIFKFQ